MILFGSSSKACAKQEKRKGCLCLTPATIQKLEEKETETSFSVKQDVAPDQSKANSPTQKQLNDNSNIISRSSGEVHLNSNIVEDSEVTDHEVIDLQSNQSFPNATIQMEESKEDEQWNRNSKHKIDFSDCKASVNTDNLKMLSLLDFAGQSAYYACHHIFFSPRAFFILVVDMTKDLDSVATEACRKEDLIYSNWTYAGI